MSTILLKVVGYKSFARKDGSVGQTIVALNDKGYRCNYDCVDKSSFDFSPLANDKNTKNVIEFVVGDYHTRLIKACANDGSSFYMNIPSFRLLSFKIV